MQKTYLAVDDSGKLLYLLAVGYIELLPTKLFHHQLIFLLPIDLGVLSKTLFASQFDFASDNSSLATFKKT